MKKLSILLTLLCIFALGILSSNAMDSQTLFSNPARYRVISTEPGGIVYVDMESISGMQTMDYPNSIENINCTLYVEKYNSTIDAMTFAENKTIRQINEYDASFHANKVENTYILDANLSNIYKPTGEAYTVTPDTLQWGNTKDMFIVLHRLSRAQAQYLS